MDDNEWNPVTFKPNPASKQRYGDDPTCATMRPCNFIPPTSLGSSSSMAASSLLWKSPCGFPPKLSILGCQFLDIRQSQNFSEFKKMTHVSGYKNDKCPMFFHVFLFVAVFSSNFRWKKSIRGTDLARPAPPMDQWDSNGNIPLDQWISMRSCGSWGYNWDINWDMGHGKMMQFLWEFKPFMKSDVWLMGHGLRPAMRNGLQRYKPSIWVPKKKSVQIHSFMARWEPTHPILELPSLTYCR